MLSVKPWRADAVFFFVIAQVAFVFLGAMTLGVLQKIGLTGFKHDDDLGTLLIGTMSFQGATWILMAIFFRLHGIRLSEGLGLRNKNLLRSLALAFVVFIVILPVAYGLGQVSTMLMEKMHWTPKKEEAVALVTDASSLASAIYLGFFAIVLAPVAEEFIFRGVLFPFVKQLGFPRTAWIGISLLFALVHLSAAYFIPLFVLALALTWLYERTDNLLAPIFVHALFNAVGIVLIDFFS